MSNIIQIPGIQSNGDLVDLNGNIMTSKERSDLIQVVNSLPINLHISEIQDAVADSLMTIIAVETGGGKTTQVPKILYQAPHIKAKKIVTSEPRVIAATGAAKRVSKELLASTLNPDFTIGYKVGYRTGKEKLSIPDSDILFVTDGLQLLRQFVSEVHPDILILDEVHTYSIPTEFLAAQINKLMLNTKKRIKLVFMSATMDTTLVSDFYSDLIKQINQTKNIPILNIPGRTFPVKKEEKLSKDFIPSILDFAKQNKNILVFVDGKKEIDSVIDQVRGQLPDYNILPLHSELPIAEQNQVLEKQDKPTIIVATNIAQESITIDYINAVVDNGYRKLLKVNSNGVPELFRVPVSFADSEQRAGRSGRVQEGEYVWANKIPREELEAFPRGEIENITLERYILIALSTGFDPKKEIKTGKKVFIHNPDKTLLELSYKNLKKLGAIDEQNKITELGQELLNLPLDPNIGIMLLNGIKRGCSGNMAEICAIMNHKGFIGKGEKWKDFIKGKYKLDSDLIALSELLKIISTREPLGNEMIGRLKKEGISSHEINLFQEYAKNGKEYMLYEIVDLSLLGIKTKRINEILNTIETLKQRLTEGEFGVEYSENTEEIVKSILSGMLDSVFTWDKKTKMFYNKKKGGFQKPINSCIKDVSSKYFYVGYPFIIGSSDEETDCTPLLFFITKVDEGHIDEVGHDYIQETFKDVKFMTKTDGKTKRGKDKLKPRIMANLQKDLGGLNISNILAEVANTKLDDVISFHWLPDFMIENNLSIIKFIKSYKAKNKVFNIDRFKQILTLFTPLLSRRFYANDMARTINGYIHDSSIFYELINSLDSRVKEFLENPYKEKYENDIIQKRKHQGIELTKELEEIRKKKIIQANEINEGQIVSMEEKAEKLELDELREEIREKQEKALSRARKADKETKKVKKAPLKGKDAKVKKEEMDKEIRLIQEKAKITGISKESRRILIQEVIKKYGFPVENKKVNEKKGLTEKERKKERKHKQRKDEETKRLINKQRKKEIYCMKENAKILNIPENEVKLLEQEINIKYQTKGVLKKAGKTKK
ncbi:DEAD/DEAH box helicase [Candidatus Gracilibacteria bacterium]|nr:DEAD/DEAH box helicase [Candidatus Gracilibacteria bacterium]